MMGALEKYSELSSCSTKRLIGHRKKVQSVAFSSDGQLLGTASSDMNVRIWDVDQISSSSISSFSSSVELRAHNLPVEALAWDPTHAKRVASASTDKTVRLWDLRSSNRTPKTVVKTTGENINLAWSPDGMYLAVGNKDDVLTFIDARIGKAVQTKHSSTEVNQVKWSPGGTLFFLTLGSGKVDIVNWPTMHRTKRIYGHMDRCYCIDFDSKMTKFAVGGADAVVSLWDFDELYCVRTLERHSSGIRTVSFSHDGMLLASGSEDPYIDISDTETGELVYSYPLRRDREVTSGAVTSVCWHPSQPLLALAFEDTPADGFLHIFGFSGSATLSNRPRA